MLFANQLQLLQEIAHNILLRKQLRPQMLLCLMVPVHEFMDGVGHAEVLRICICAACGEAL
jgi:hypothetical protein